VTAAARPLWRPELLDALRLLAHISEALVARGAPRPILVGGAAAEYYSGSALMTGDVDLTSPVQGELEAEMQRHGFVKPSGSGRMTRGWVHPELGLGFEIVATSPFAGSPSQARVILVGDLAPGSAFAIVSVEDLIADRMGQYGSGTADEMLGQARELFRLHPGLDRAYLERRIREESSGDHGVEDLES